MEKIGCICLMRELFCSMNELENSLIDIYGVSLNEAMVMCSIGDEEISAGDIASRTGLKSSHLSKILRSVEDKEFVRRNFGNKDKRQVYFSLTDKALICLDNLRKNELPIPENLKIFFDSGQNH